MVDMLHECLVANLNGWLNQPKGESSRRLRSDRRSAFATTIWRGAEIIATFWAVPTRQTPPREVSRSKKDPSESKSKNTGGQQIMHVRHADCPLEHSEKCYLAVANCPIIGNLAKIPDSGAKFIGPMHPLHVVRGQKGPIIYVQ